MSPTAAAKARPLLPASRAIAAPMCALSRQQVPGESRTGIWTKSESRKCVGLKMDKCRTTCSTTRAIFITFSVGGSTLTKHDGLATLQR